MNFKRKVFGGILGLTFSTLPVSLLASQGEKIDTGATAWMLTSTALVLLMVPGLAMFYGGLVRTKNVLGTMMHSFAAMAIVGVLWVVCGYSMSFGEGVLGGFFGWNWDYFMLQGIDTSIVDGIPEYVFAMFQGKFAIITPALIAGAFAERVQFRGYAIFIALWSLIIYNPLCHWVWASDGIIFNMGADGAIDFAGGTVVHISAGASALVAAFYIGPRQGFPQKQMPPSNLVMTMMGAGLLWVGWFGFNAGSSVSSGLATAQALTATQVAAASGALAWILIEALHHRKATCLGIVSGILAGLVVITPAAGVVQPGGAIVLGFIASLGSYYAIMLKNRFGYDDTLDVFGIHGVAAIIGALMLTFFIRPSWMEHAKNLALEKGLGDWSIWDQFGIQLASVAVSMIYAGGVTLILLVLIEKTVGFRIDSNDEKEGMDQSLHSEYGYGMIHFK